MTDEQLLAAAAAMETSNYGENYLGGVHDFEDLYPLNQQIAAILRGYVSAPEEIKVAILKTGDGTIPVALAWELIVGGAALSRRPNPGETATTSGTFVVIDPEDE